MLPSAQLDLIIFLIICQDGGDYRSHPFFGTPRCPAGDTQIHPCIRVTGKIVLERNEPDGDIHIQLKPDKQFLPLLNARNKSAQRGALVLEPICVNHPTQPDAIQPCQGLTNHVAIPTLGAHVAVTGTYVDDIEQGHGWMEIHPVTLIEPN